jgi:ribosomal protein S18 acetylase RimI-like enzyme
VKTVDVQIEVASSIDLATIMALERQCFTSEAFSRQQILYLLEDYNSISLTARVNGEIAGFIILQLDTDEEDGAVFGHIITLNVAAVFRRKGIAQKLLVRCEELLKLQGVFECRLEVRQANYGALKLYRQMGYVETGLLKKYYGKEHGLYFKKKF